MEYAFNRIRRYRIHKTCTSTDKAAKISLLTLFFTAPFVSALICIYHLPRTIITKSYGKIYLFPFRQPAGIFIHVTSRITCQLCQLPACFLKKWLTLRYNPAGTAGMSDPDFLSGTLRLCQPAGTDRFLRLRCCLQDRQLCHADRNWDRSCRSCFHGSGHCAECTLFHLFSAEAGESIRPKDLGPNRLSETRTGHVEAPTCPVFFSYILLLCSNLFVIHEVHVQTTVLISLWIFTEFIILARQDRI